LKALQTGDLRRRRERYPQTNEMFLAYQVEPASNGAAMTQPLILDLDQVHNFPPYARKSNNQEYVRGDLLGFCEITQRAYGLGRQIDETEMMRPVLTNLAVSRTARKLGIGSQLLDECEGHAARQWKLNEMVLEVEDYNTRALDFYGKRGYNVVFSDPASRRFDVGGLVLRKVRCTRNILRKTLELQRAQSASDEVNFSFDFFQKFRETVGV
jgi:GNAT superfamily N-acetyltransferase